MRVRKPDSRAMRQAAEQFVEQLAAEDLILESQHEELVTSLVRQWITYEGNATVFIGELQFQLLLRTTPLGRFRVVPNQANSDWWSTLQRDWKIALEELPDVFEQLNRGQSADVTNANGIPLRLWVNPKARSVGVEELVKRPVPPGHKRDYHKIASNQLEQVFAGELDEDELGLLVGSVVRQWQQFDGHACIFLDGKRLVALTLTEQADGGCTVAVRRARADTQSFLLSLGCPLEDVPAVIGRINLGQPVELRDPQDVAQVLTHNPQEGRLHLRPSAAVPAVQGTAPPVRCPTCSADFAAPTPMADHLRCPVCGQEFPRP